MFTSGCLLWLCCFWIERNFENYADGCACNSLEHVSIKIGVKGKYCCLLKKKNTILVFVQWNLWWRYFSWKLFTKWKRSLRKNVSTKNTTAVPATANVVSDIKRMVIFWWAKKRLLVHMFLQIKILWNWKQKEKEKKSIDVNVLRVTVHTIPLEMIIERILLVECFALVPLYFFGKINTRNKKEIVWKSL